MFRRSFVFSLLFLTTAVVYVVCRNFTLQENSSDVICEMGKEDRNCTSFEMNRLVGHPISSPVHAAFASSSRPISYPIAEASSRNLRRTAADANSGVDTVRLAVEKNQVMDALLNRPDIPSDYGAEMVALYRDRTQDVYTRGSGGNDPLRPKEYIDNRGR